MQISAYDKDMHSATLQSESENVTARNATGNHGKDASPGEINGLIVLKAGDGGPDSLPQFWVPDLEEKQRDQLESRRRCTRCQT